MSLSLLSAFKKAPSLGKYVNDSVAQWGAYCHRVCGCTAAKLPDYTNNSLTVKRISNNIFFFMSNKFHLLPIDHMAKVDVPDSFTSHIPSALAIAYPQGAPRSLICTNGVIIFFLWWFNMLLYQ